MLSQVRQGEPGGVVADAGGDQLAHLDPRQDAGKGLAEQDGVLAEVGDQ